MYMATISLAEARAAFSRIVESAATTHERFEVTRNGRRAAVVLGADDYDSLLETIAILGDGDILTAITTGLAELESGQTVEPQAVRAAMLAAKRLSP
jgi:prevent-host-death family protein